MEPANKSVLGYVAYNITAESQAMLLRKFPPRFKNVVCHHITVEPNVASDHALPAPARIRVVGYSSDDVGLETLVVEVCGTDGVFNHLGPKGRTFHITHSIADGREKYESNTVIKEHGCKPIPEPFEIDTVPKWNE